MVRVFVVQDNRLLRAALHCLLAQPEDLLVVGTAATDSRLVSRLAAARPDVAVVDIDSDAGLHHGIRLASEPAWDGAHDHTRLPDGAAPLPAVLMLTGTSAPVRLHRALAAEPRGLISKDISADTLIQTVRRLGRGEIVVEQDLAVAARRVTRFPLTPREQQVLRLVADGASASEIAERLGLSTGTVRNYLSSVICKTRARNRVDAIRVARQAGWL